MSRFSHVGRVLFLFTSPRIFQKVTFEFQRMTCNSVLCSAGGGCSWHWNQQTLETPRMSAFHSPWRSQSSSYNDKVMLWKTSHLYFDKTYWRKLKIRIEECLGGSPWHVSGFPFVHWDFPFLSFPMQSHELPQICSWGALNPLEQICGSTWSSGETEKNGNSHHASASLFCWM